MGNVATSECETAPAPSPEKEVVFVVGLGMVGIAFIEKLLNLDDARRYIIITCGEEPHFAYNRVGLTEYFEHRNVESLYLNPPSWYATQQPDRFRYYLKETVTSISPDKHLIHTDQRRFFRYDKCVIATGSTGNFPPYLSSKEAQATPGVFGYRSIADLDAIIAYAENPNVQNAVVVGGGLLGLEAAKAAYDLPTISNVSIVNRQAYPLSRQLDSDAGEMVLKKIEAMGVRVLTKCSPLRHVTRPREDGSGKVFAGLELSNGTVHEADLVIYAIGIRPRDDVARASGIQCHDKGGIIVGDDLTTSAEDVYAIGECARWQDNVYGLIGPGIEMADILAFNLTQTLSHARRVMNAPDLSTKLKLMGIDVASFGDYFADKHIPAAKTQEIIVTSRTMDAPVDDLRDKGRPLLEIGFEDPKILKTTNQQPKVNDLRPRHRHARKDDQPPNCLVYKDPFGATYKKYIFTSDGKYLLGGMMVGDVGDFVKLVAIVKKKKALEVPPSQFIVGARQGGEDGNDLDDDAQICSCHNVSKGDIIKCITKDNCLTIPDLKNKTKAGTGCGGCMPMVTSIFKAEMKKAGRKLDNNLCPHFAMNRVDLFRVVKIKALRTFTDIMKEIGVKPDSLGCEICKPAVGSILSSLYNEHVMKPAHHQNQDTNDRFLANVQRDGTFSVVPRIAAGEVTPEGLIVIGRVAKKYGLYTKITGAQRIDMFGAQRDDLPEIWAELNAAGFESGHAYGKSLRTVKSCVGTTWCRYGVGDSVGLAIQLENRYKGVRSPHKFKGGVSGCVRECAEAQSKDFGVIATDKGWNIFVGGNGGANPRHADLLAKDVPPSKVVQIIDRYLGFYIMTADRLQRTATWIQNMEGGIEKLRRVILQDELGICKDLDALMSNLVSTYNDEWAEVVQDPSKRKQFRQLVNTDERLKSSEVIQERGQRRPADWPKEFPSLKFDPGTITTPKSEWKWINVAKKMDLMPSDSGTTSTAIKYGDTQLAVYHVPQKGYYAAQRMCPHKRAFVLDHGIIGDTPNGDLYISCPLHKRNFSLTKGQCLNDDDYDILLFDAREDNEMIQLLLPPEDDLDRVLGTDKWLIRQAESEALGLNAATQIDFAAPRIGLMGADGASSCGGSCGNSQLDW